MNCFSEHSAEIQAIAAIVQAMSAAAIVGLTVWLALSTQQYAELTRDSLSVSREQFEREWLPYWHLFLTQEGQEVMLRVSNLSRNSARVTHLFLRIESERGSRKQWDFDLALASRERERANVTSHVQETIKHYVLGGIWQGVLEVAVGFVVAGTEEPRPSQWFPFKMAVRDGNFVEVKPKMPYIAADLST